MLFARQATTRPTPSHSRYFEIDLSRDKEAEVRQTDIVTSFTSSQARKIDGFRRETPTSQQCKPIEKRMYFVARQVTEAKTVLFARRTTARPYFVSLAVFRDRFVPRQRSGSSAVLFVRRTTLMQYSGQRCSKDPFIPCRSSSMYIPLSGQVLWLLRVHPKTGTAENQSLIPRRWS